MPKGVRAEPFKIHFKCDICFLKFVLRPREFWRFSNLCVEAESHLNALLVETLFVFNDCIYTVNIWLDFGDSVHSVG